MKLTKKILRNLIKESLNENKDLELYKSMTNMSSQLQMGDTSPRQKITGQLIDVLQNFMVDKDMDYEKLKDALIKKIDSASRLDAYNLNK